MKCEHEIAVGAYVLDALEPDEQLRMQRHVHDCPVCAATVRELEGLPRLLSAVPTPGEAPPAPAPSELAFERFRRSAAALPGRPRRRVRRWWIAAAAAVLVAVAGVVTTVVATRAPEPTVVEATDNGVHVRAAYLGDAAGTTVELTLQGLPLGQRCTLVAVADDGRETATDPWRVSDEGTYHWSGWVGVRPPHIEQLVIRTMDGKPLVTLPV